MIPQILRTQAEMSDSGKMGHMGPVMCHWVTTEGTTGARLLIANKYTVHGKVTINAWNARHALPLQPASNTANGLAVRGQTPQTLHETLFDPIM